jgi:hypothetical protein
MYTLLIIGAVVILVAGIPALELLMNGFTPSRPSRKSDASDSARHAEASIDSGGRNDREAVWARLIPDAVEFRQLVEDQHDVMGERHPTGPHAAIA